MLLICLLSDVLEELRRRAFRTPSRERKRMVDSRSSNCMAAVPKVSGDASRTRAWFSANVKMRDAAWRKTSEDAELNDADSKED